MKFDDGDSRYVRHSEVLPIERLPLGQPVMVQSQDGYFDAGLIVGQVKKGGVFQYSVEKDSGEQRLWVTPYFVCWLSVFYHYAPLSGIFLKDLGILEY